MQEPNVLFILKNPLLNLALTKIIKDSKSSLNFIESNAQQYDELLMEIKTLIADVIILDKASYFASEEILTKLLNLYPKLLLILVDQDSNWLQVYRREDILINSSAELMEIIKSS